MYINNKMKPHDNRNVCEYIENIRQLTNIIDKLRVKDYDSVEDIIEDIQDISSYIDDNIDYIQDAVNRMERKLYACLNAIENLGFVKLESK